MKGSFRITSTATNDPESLQFSAVVGLIGLVGACYQVTWDEETQNDGYGVTVRWDMDLEEQEIKDELEELRLLVLEACPTAKVL